MALTTSTEFELSYTQAAEYPCNLYNSYTYSTTLSAYKTRLEKAAENLFVGDSREIKVPFRDLVPTQDPNIFHFKKQNVFSERELKAYFGDQSSTDPLSNVRTGALVTETDPLISFIFAADAQDPLKLNRSMLVQILSYHQVMPSFLEFLLLFGLKTRPVDLRYSGFREETSLGSPAPSHCLPALGRSGKHFELCYNLKGATEKSTKKWRIHHTAVYHKFDVLTGKAIWILVKGSLDLKDRIEPATGKQLKEQSHNFHSVEARFGSSLAIHLLIAHWAGESWRWYLQHLEDEMDHETKDARYEDRMKGVDIKIFTSRDLQNIQVYTEKANEIVTVIESNIEVLTALRNYYENLILDHDFPNGNSAVTKASVSRLARQLNNIIYDLRMQIARAKLLAQEIQSRKDLILQHLQSQNTQSMEALTLATYQVTKIAQKDAIAIRIITIVTLFYLPATFVSSFFSTDVVKYQDPNSSPPNSTTSFSDIALDRWLQVTIPLTALTLIFSYAGYLLAKSYVRKQNPYESDPV